MKISNTAQQITRDIYRAAIARTILSERDAKKLLCIVADLAAEGRITSSLWQYDQNTKNVAPEAYPMDKAFGGTMVEFAEKMTPSEKVAKVAEWLSYIVGVTIPDGVAVEKVREFWTPGAEYLMKLPKPVLQEAAEACKIKDLPEKKTQMVQAIAEAFEQGKGKTWLPQPVDAHLKARTYD